MSVLRLSFIDAILPVPALRTALADVVMASYGQRSGGYGIRDQIKNPDAAPDQRSESEPIRRPQDYRADQGARFEVHFGKNRGFHGDDVKPFVAALGVVGWTMRDLADADGARVAVLSAEGMTEREIARGNGPL